jgi:hypothetical protein
MENFSELFLGAATLKERLVEWFSYCGNRSTIIALGTVDGSLEDAVFVIDIEPRANVPSNIWSSGCSPRNLSMGRSFGQEKVLTRREPV